MKRIITTLAMIIAATTFVFGQSKAEQEIGQTLGAIADALVKNDTALLANYYADSYTITNAQGETMSKAQRLELIKNTKRESFSYGDVNIRVFGDTAVVIASPIFTSIGLNGQKTDVKDRATITMMKNGGRWQIVAVQSSNNLLNQSGGSDEQAVRQTITELMNALSRNDLETVGRIYADDYQIVLQDGTTTTKAERLNAMKSGNLKYSGLTFDNLKIRQYGNAAVATYRVTGKSITSSGEQNLNHQATVTLVKNGSRWQVVSSQLTNNVANSYSVNNDEEQAIRQTFEQMNTAMLKDDFAARERLYGDDYVYTGSNGERQNKAERLAAEKNSTWNFAAFKRDIESVRTSGDWAVVVSRVDFTGKNKTTGVTWNGAYRNTATLAKRNGGWLIVASQTTRVVPQPDEKELNKFMDDYTTFLSKNSADEAAKFLAADYTRIGADGSVLTKDEHLATIRSGVMKYQSVETTDRKWRFMGFGGVAIVTSRLQLKASNKGKDVSGAYRVTTVLRRDGIDRWVIASTQISPLAGN